MLINILFIFFSSMTLLSSLLVITVQNSVYSVLFLVLSFISSAGILLILECEFLAFMFIIVYVGAIAVLFLFIVMMLDVKITNSNRFLFKYFPIGLIIGIIFSLETLVITNKYFKHNYYSDSIYENSYVNWFDKIDTFSDVESLGQVIFTQYVLQFLVAGNILLLATISVVVLTINTSSNKKTQIIFKQITRSHKNVLLLT